MPWLAAWSRITALSQSFSGKLARRAASSAFLRASGRTPLTLHGKPKFMLAPKSEVETQESVDPCGRLRVSTARGYGARSFVHVQLFAGHGKQVVNFLGGRDLGDIPWRSGTYP